MTIKGLMTSTVCLCLVLLAASDGFCQQQGSSGSTEAEEEGRFEIILKSQPPKTIRVDSLMLDRDQDKILGDTGRVDQDERRFYRVEPGGYLGFKESEWVDKLSFRAFSRPVTEMPMYKEYAELLAAITTTIFQFKQTLGAYDQFALRLVQVCDDSRFKSVQDIDNRIRDQLNAYSSLEKLRQNVLVSLKTFTETGACKDLVRDYEKSLNQSIQELSELSKKRHLIENRVNQMEKEARETLQRSRGQPPSGDPFNKTPLKY